MSQRQLIPWILLAWTAGMAVWLVLYPEEDVTCGPEIYEDCRIGLKVTAGLGRSGVVLLWALGAAALLTTWLTVRSAATGARERPAVSTRGAVVVAVVAVPVGAAGIALALSGDLSPDDAAPAVQVRVTSAVLQPAATKAGALRRRARLSLRVQIINRSADPIPRTRPVLLTPEPLPPDPRARQTTGTLLRPLPPARTAGGTLRFETAGAATTRLRTDRRGRLRIGGQTVSFRVLVRALPPVPEPGPPPAPARVRVQVLRAVLQPAVTPTGRRGQRARLSLRVRVTNRSADPVARTEPVLLTPRPLPSDPRARQTTGTLLRPLLPARVALGTLRFETGGAATTRLLTDRRGRLRIGGQTVSFPLLVEALAPETATAP